MYEKEKTRVQGKIAKNVYMMKLTTHKYYFSAFDQTYGCVVWVCVGCVWGVCGGVCVGWWVCGGFGCFFFCKFFILLMQPQ